MNHLEGKLQQYTLSMLFGQLVEQLPPCWKLYHLLEPCRRLHKYHLELQIHQSICLNILYINISKCPTIAAPPPYLSSFYQHMISFLWIKVLQDYCCKMLFNHCLYFFLLAAGYLQPLYEKVDHLWYTSITGG